MAYCPNCGHQVDAGDAFCPNCGQDLREDQELTLVPAQETTVTPQAPASPEREEQPGAPTPPPKRGAYHQVLIGAVIALLLVGVAGVLYLSFGRQLFGGHEGTPSSTASQQEAPASLEPGTVSDARQASSETSESASASSSQEAVSKEVVLEIESSSSTLVSTAFDNQTVATAFDQLFGHIGGQHALYFVPLTNQAGQAVDASPLVVNSQALRSASVIKLFVLATFLQQVESGKVSLSDTYTLASQDVVGGTGNIQSYSPGTQLTYADLAREMIINSDNMAMNVLVDRLGGFEAVNQTIAGLGYSQSRLNRKMMDFDAVNRGVDNYVSASEVGDLLRRVYLQTLISPQADQQFLSILSGQTDRTNLEAQLPVGVTTYNKTGQNGNQGVRNDAAIIAGPNGAFVLVVLSQDGSEDAQIAAMQQLGSRVYQLYQP